MVVALAALALVGAALVVFALVSQVGQPPEPGLRTNAGASDSGGSTSENRPESTKTLATPSTDASSPTQQSSRKKGAPGGAEPIAAEDPTELRIPSIDLDEKLFPIGLGEDGGLLAPRGERANQPAWYAGSPTPGEIGPAVIEGHVTWHNEPSVFFELGGLKTGDNIEVKRKDGSLATFEVYDSARYPKDEFPTLDVYGRTDGPELRLITCGGDLGKNGHHLDNTVIYARLSEN
ncbi:class F sortase [Brachybacterium endophyticum]|uniref:Class F sortase n=2 Tax=Brachybacterium endophyticum TaxID=2182385 RepID=A0A2U2RGD5_9MICO|nr:class F sortase [Brachybacterium endophyticum]